MIVLVINCGSSSLKYSLIDMQTQSVLADGVADRVSVNGGTGAVLKHRPSGRDAYIAENPMTDHSVAMRYVLEALTDPEHGVIASLDEIAAVGHRVVHGGEKFSESVLISEPVIEAVEDCNKFAPLHNPANLQGIRACTDALPGIPQVAVFDTGFHQTMPQRAYLYGLPYEYYTDLGVRRYGFHGTSHRYVTLKAGEWLLAEKRIPIDEQRIITCHLGNGCSMAAVLGGKSVDTSMGLTPLEGLIMGTRCGDLDPAILPFLQAEMNLSSEDIDRILNKSSGLLGISGVSSDMRDVKAAAFGEEPNHRCVAAIEVFAYRVRKYFGAYAAALGGLDAIVFTAGIGENEPLIRSLSTEGLRFMGVAVDVDKNEKVDKRNPVSDISENNATAAVLVIPTNEELMIAMDTVEIVGCH
ncbi:MAG: acetate kinase [Armatimonadetes bacterium]|nr:acetate kinase [Armatimonadota bacterium]